LRDGPTIRRVLVADRRGAALRLARWGRQAGVEVVALARPEEAEAGWLDAVDFCIPVPPARDRSWPDPTAAVSALHDSGCDALHPGCGDAARSLRLVEQLAYAGVAWAGPGLESLGLALDRSISLIRARGAGIAVVPSSGPLCDLEAARSWLVRVGLPARIRPVDVEIGHPRPVLTEFAQVDVAIPRWLRLGPLVLEREVAGAREIEVPVLVDAQGAAVAVGDRDVTLRDKRRHLLVEAPAPGLSDALRYELARTAESFANELEWRGLCTVRFLLAPDGRAYLLQLRPGLQPWHGATEVAYDVDLVDAQMRLASRDALRWKRAAIQARVSAVWAGVVADNDGTVDRVDNGGLRIDPEVVVGESVEAGDPLLGMVAHGPTRQAAIVRLRAWLDADPIGAVALSRRALDACVGAPAWWQGPLNRDVARALTDLPAEPLSEDF